MSVNCADGAGRLQRLTPFVDAIATSALQVVQTMLVGREVLGLQHSHHSRSAQTTTIGHGIWTAQQLVAAETRSTHVENKQQGIKRARRTLQYSYETMRGVGSYGG